MRPFHELKEKEKLGNFLLTETENKANRLIQRLLNKKGTQNASLFMDKKCIRQIFEAGFLFKIKAGILLQGRSVH